MTTIGYARVSTARHGTPDSFSHNSGSCFVAVI